MDSSARAKPTATCDHGLTAQMNNITQLKDKDTTAWKLRGFRHSSVYMNHHDNDRKRNHTKHLRFPD